MGLEQISAVSSATRVENLPTIGLNSALLAGAPTTFGTAARNGIRLETRQHVKVRVPSYPMLWIPDKLRFLDGSQASPVRTSGKGNM